MEVNSEVKKGLLSIILVIFTTLVAGCSNSGNKILFTTISHIDMTVEGHIKQVHDYDSVYTICYENENSTYSLYVFTSPVQYKTQNGKYAIIDNTVVKSKKSGFAFENKANNVKTYFPTTFLDAFRIEKGTGFLEFNIAIETAGFSDAKQIVFTNMYGIEVSAVVYERNDIDLFFYPTKAGIKTEIVLKDKPENNEFSFIVKSSAINYGNKNKGYILFENDVGNECVIYQPLIQYIDNNKQQLDVTTQMKISKKGDDYKLEMIIDDNIIENAEYPIKFDPSFEMYFDKMADSTVYSEHDTNNYLANYAVIGEHEVFGEGWHYVRSRFRYYSRMLKPSQIISSFYYTHVLSNINENGGILSIYGLDTQWSSTNMKWLDKVEPKNNISVSEHNGRMIKFDITDFTKECLKDPDLGMESRGFVMLSDEMKIIATSDNSAIVPFYRIDMKELPGGFIENEYINPPIGNSGNIF